MTEFDPFSSLCRMPVILALYELTGARAKFPGVAEADLIALLKGEHRTASLDYAGAAELESRIGAIEAGPFPSVVLDVITRLLGVFEPAWLPLVPRGRLFVAQALGRDQVQCFRSAGLMEVEPQHDALRWWDRLACRVRADDLENRVEVGRKGERLSFDLETSRVKGLGIMTPPQWVALENNRLGYDILSYALRPEGLVNRLIEVKTTTSAAPRFFISRAEWERALIAPEAYIVHVWMLPEETLTELSVSDLKENIPMDRGVGQWDRAVVALA